MKHIVKKADLLSEQESYKNDMEILAERLLETKYATPKYENVALGIDKVYDDPRTRRRAINTLVKMDNQEKYFEKVARYIPEATFTANFGTTPQAIIRAIRVANPNSIIEDICDVQTISSMVGIIGFIKPVFTRSIRGATAGDLLVESKVKDYAAENIDLNVGTGNGATTSFSVTFPFFPVRPSSIIVYKANVEIARDNGSGLFTNTNGSELNTTTSSVEYTGDSGSLTLVFNSAPASAVDISITYNWDTEQNTADHGEIELQWASQGVKAEMHPLNFRFSLTSMLLAESANFSVEEVLNDAATQYLKAERDRRGVEFNALLSFANATSTFNASPSSSGDNNNKMHAQLLELEIERRADAMYDSKGRGGVSYIIAGSQAATYINLLDNFVKDNTQSPIGCYRVGYLGKAPVIKARITSAKLGSNEVLVGYRSEWGEAPFVHADYLDYATETLTTRDFISQKGLASYYQNVKVESSFVRKISITNFPV